MSAIRVQEWQGTAAGSHLFKADFGTDIFFKAESLWDKASLIYIGVPGHNIERPCPRKKK